MCQRCPFYYFLPGNGRLPWHCFDKHFLLSLQRSHWRIIPKEHLSPGTFVIGHSQLSVTGKTPATLMRGLFQAADEVPSSGPQNSVAQSSSPLGKCSWSRLLSQRGRRRPRRACNMEALEVDDISPALEVTEDFFSTFDSKLEKAVQQAEVYGIQEVPELVGHEVLSNITDNGAIRNVASLGEGGMLWDHCQTRFLETKVQNVFPTKEQFMVQKGTAPDNLSWMEQKEASTFNFFNICQRRRDRPRSVNDLLDETTTFKPGHARSRSDVTQVDWRVILKTTPLQQHPQQPSLQGPHFTRPSFLLPSSNKIGDAQGNTGMFLYLIAVEQLLIFLCVFYIFSGEYYSPVSMSGYAYLSFLFHLRSHFILLQVYSLIFMGGTEQKDSSGESFLSSLVGENQSSHSKWSIFPLNIGWYCFFTSGDVHQITHWVQPCAMKELKVCEDAIPAIKNFSFSWGVQTQRLKKAPSRERK